MKGIILNTTEVKAVQGGATMIVRPVEPQPIFNFYAAGVSMYSYEGVQFADAPGVPPLKVGRDTINHLSPFGAEGDVLRVDDMSLEIVNVAVNRVQDASEGEIIQMGCPNEYLLGRSWLQPEWDSRYAKRGLGWDVNPWAWFIEVKRVGGEI